MRYVIREKETLPWGNFDEKKAVSAAEACPFFAEDSPEECISDCRRSCLNCRYRRWTRESYVCLKAAAKEKMADAYSRGGSPGV